MKKAQAWKAGDVFIIGQSDGLCTAGQVIEPVLKNVVSCAFYDIRTACDITATTLDLAIRHLVAVLSVSREKLDLGKWRIVGNQPVAIDRELWPNEEFRRDSWVGAKIYDAAIVEELLNAFNGLVAWDNFHDPTYLDKLLVAPDRKPKHVVYKRR